MFGKILFGIWKACRKQKASFSRSMAQQLYIILVPIFSRSTVEQELFGLTWHILTPSPPQCPTFARWLVDLLICLLECESSVWLASVAWLLHDRMILAHTCWPGHCQDKKQWKAYGHMEVNCIYHSVQSTSTIQTSRVVAWFASNWGGLGLPGTRLRCAID